MSKKAKEIIRQKALETFDEKTVGVALYTPPEWIVEAVKEYHQSQLNTIAGKSDSQTRLVRKTIEMLSSMIKVGDPHSSKMIELANKAMDGIEKRLTSKTARQHHQSQLNIIADKVAYTLENSLGECVQGNEYRIRPIEGQFWIEHKGVGSSEPLWQWIETEVKQAINSNFNKEDKEA